MPRLHVHICILRGSLFNCLSVMVTFQTNVLYLCRDLSHLVSSALPCFPFAPVPEYTKFNRLHLKGATHPYRRSLHADYVQSVSIFSCHDTCIRFGQCSGITLLGAFPMQTCSSLYNVMGIWNEMPASLRELPKKPFQTKLHSFLLDIQKHDDYIDIS